MPLKQAIASVRDSVCAVMRIHPLGNNQYDVSVAGTAWCIVDNKYLITAFHIFNNCNPRDPNDRFFVFSVPDNDEKAFHVPVTAFHLEDAANDIAIMEIDISGNKAFSLKSVPITFRKLEDGERVLTYGFPSPIIHAGKVDNNMNWVGGALFLKAHANEGIISGQFQSNGKELYEFNVGWYQGESGGPIFTLDPVAAISLMQTYRGVSTPHGVVPGPHQGCSLRQIEKELIKYGAEVV